MHIDISKVPIPVQLAKRPRDKRGLPVPYFQFIPPNFAVDQIVDFRVTDPYRRTECLQNKLCGLCGQPLGFRMCFIGGDMSVKNRIYSDPPSHEKCARYAMKVCPFLAMPNYKVIEGVVKTTEGFVTQQDAFAAADRPKEMFLYITDGYEITRIKDGRTGKIHPVVYALANPYKVLEPF